MKTIYLAGGCFWGTQRFFDQFDGVVRTEVGYANGGTERPSNEDVKMGSGHAETVKIEYDESVLPTLKLLDYYFMVIDPTSVNKQGGDVGVQYRTGIYYSDPSLLPDIEAACEAVRRRINAPLAVETAPLAGFWPAEEYHQKYLEKNPAGYCHIPREMMRLADSN